MLDNNIPLGKIKELYSGNIRESGLKSSSVGWNTLESQLLRFDKLTSVISDTSSPLSVNDYGCGYGSHLKYLLSQCNIQVSDYFGYDLSEDMLRAAKSYLSAFKGSLSLLCSSDISTIADYTFVSGTFNVKLDADDAVWKSFIKNKLDQIDQCSRRGFAFNLLSTYVDWQESHLFYGDPCFWFDYCKCTYSRQVALLHDYPLHEWTIVVRK